MSTWLKERGLICRISQAGDIKIERTARGSISGANHQAVETDYDPFR